MKVQQDEPCVPSLEAVLLRLIRAGHVHQNQLMIEAAEIMLTNNIPCQALFSLSEHCHSLAHSHQSLPPRTLPLNYPSACI
jgi:hypothetical protein